MNAPAGERDDAALVRSALAGDDDAFSALMQRHKAPLYRFVRRYVGDAEETQDLVQETFVAAWASLGSFDTARPLPAWLRRIALNKCRDWGRRRQVRRFFFGAKNIDAAGPIAAEAPDVDAQADVLLQLDVAIAALPAQLKEPLILTVFENLSHAEAAALLGISAKAVETRVYRSKQALRQSLLTDEQ